jgi:spermidine/putrescine-binding protein
VPHHEWSPWLYQPGHQPWPAGDLGVGGRRRRRETVHVYNWYDYIGPNTLHDFKRDTGIQPVYDTFDSAEVLEGKLLTSRSGYDVVVASNFSLPTLIKAGALAPLPHDQCRAGRTWTRFDGETGQQ